MCCYGMMINDKICGLYNMQLSYSSLFDVMKSANTVVINGQLHETFLESLLS